MAVSSNSYFKNSAVGVPQVAGAVDLFRVDTLPKYSLGHMIETADGKRYRYVNFGAITGQGKLVSQDVSESTYALNAMTVVAPASAATTTDGTVGYKYIEVTDAARTANDLAGGYLIMTAGTGRGYTYRIKGNTVTGLPDGPASGNLRIELYDKIQATVTATTDVIGVGCKWANLEASNAADVIPAGVTVANITAADTYGWIQTRGVCGVFQDGTVPLGSIVTVSDVDSGAVMQLAGYDASNDIQEAAKEPIVGYCVSASTDAVDGVYVGVNLTIE